MAFSLIHRGAREGYRLLKAKFKAVGKYLKLNGASQVVDPRDLLIYTQSHNIKHKDFESKSDRERRDNYKRAYMVLNSKTVVDGSGDEAAVERGAWAIQTASENPDLDQHDLSDILRKVKGIVGGLNPVNPGSLVVVVTSFNSKHAACSVLITTGQGVERSSFFSDTYPGIFEPSYGFISRRLAANEMVLDHLVEIRCNDISALQGVKPYKNVRTDNSYTLMILGSISTMVVGCLPNSEKPAQDEHVALRFHDESCEKCVKKFGEKEIVTTSCCNSRVVRVATIIKEQVLGQIDDDDPVYTRVESRSPNSEQMLHEILSHMNFVSDKDHLPVGEGQYNTNSVSRSDKDRNDLLERLPEKEKSWVSSFLELYPLTPEVIYGTDLPTVVVLDDKMAKLFSQHPHYNDYVSIVDGEASNASSFYVGSLSWLKEHSLMNPLWDRKSRNFIPKGVPYCLWVFVSKWRGDTSSLMGLNDLRFTHR